MKSLKKYIGLFSAFIMGCALWSCKDNSDFIPETGDSDKVTVKFLIPESGPSFGYNNTRATDAELESSYLGSGEGAISNLYIVAVQLSYFNYKDDGSIVEQDMSSDGDSGRNRIVITPINVYDFDGVINHEKSYSLTLYPGRYRFYAFANCDLYVNNLYEAGGIYTENYIRQLALYYTSDVPLKQAHLPMCCTPVRVTYEENGIPTNTKPNENLDKENYTVPIYKGTTPKIHINLQFMCAKVRYTILFDATQPYKDKDGNWIEGISSGFGNQSIRFYVDEMGENRPVVTYLRKRTFLYPNIDPGRFEEDKNDPFIINSASVSSPENPSEPYFFTSRDGSETSSYANWPLPLNRYVWPEIGDRYPTRPMDVLDPYTGTLDDWKASRQRAWQGVVYLPENQTDGVTKSEMHFPYVLDQYAITGATEDDNIPYQDGEITGAFKTLKLFGNSSETQYEGKDGQQYNDNYGDQLDNSNYSTGLERGYFYDVVARVITPDKWDLKIIVYGQVAPWHEVEQGFMEGENPNPGGSTDSSSETIVGTDSKPWDYNDHDVTW